MWHRAVGVMVVCWLGTACNQLLGIPEATEGRHVAGRVRGLWDGTDGVSLRLVADGRTGHHFEAGNADDLAAKVVRFSASDRRANMREAARREFEDKYTPDTNYEQLIDIYRRAGANAIQSACHVNKNSAASAPA